MANDAGPRGGSPEPIIATQYLRTPGIYRRAPPRVPRVSCEEHTARFHQTESGRPCCASERRTEGAPAEATGAPTVARPLTWGARRPAPQSTKTGHRPPRRGGCIDTEIEIEGSPRDRWPVAGRVRAKNKRRRDSATGDPPVGNRGRGGPDIQTRAGRTHDTSTPRQPAHGAGRPEASRLTRLSRTGTTADTTGGQLHPPAGGSRRPVGGHVALEVNRGSTCPPGPVHTPMEG